MAFSSLVFLFVFVFHDYAVVTSYERESVGECGDPGVPASGGINPPLDPGYKVGSYVTYFCQPSHQLFGDSKRTCTQKGFWSGNVPTCGSRLPIHNVNQSSNFTTAHAAYKAVDMDYTTCSMTQFSRNNYWYGTIDPKVTVSGVRVTVPRKATELAFNLTVKIASQLNQKFVQCWKIEGYIDETNQKHSHFYLCPQNSAGTMIFLERIADKPIPLDLCEVEIFTTQNLDCKIPDNPKNGHKMVHFGSNGTYYVYSCSLGFELRGAGMIHCFSNGTWHPKVPTCVAITCLSAPPISNGYYKEVKKSVVQGYIYNDSVQYHCEAGYELSGDRNNQKFCVGVNRWSGNPLSCKERLISTLISTTSASAKCNQFESEINDGILIHVKDMVILQCNQGFEPLYHSNSTCVLSERGRFSWSPSPIFRCHRSNAGGSVKPILCPLPSAPKGTKLSDDVKKGEKFEVGSKMEVRCLYHDGETEGAKSRDGLMTCTANGTWDLVHLKCVEFSLSSDKVMFRPSGDSTSFYIVAAFLIGVGTAVLIIGASACLFVLRKSRLAGTQQSQSLFHIDFTDTLNVHPGNTLMRMNSYNANTRPSINDDEHIYQMPAYGEIERGRGSGSSASEPETPKKRKPCSGLPLVPIYSQPFEETLTGNRAGINPSVHIYAEPVLGIFQNSNSNASLESIGTRGSFSDSSVYFANGEPRILGDSSGSMTNDLYSDNDSLRMVDNDLYVSDDESTK